MFRKDATLAIQGFPHCMRRVSQTSFDMSTIGLRTMRRSRQDSMLNRQSVEICSDLGTSSYAPEAACHRSERKAANFCCVYAAYLKWAGQVHTTDCIVHPQRCCTIAMCPRLNMAMSECAGTQSKTMVACIVCGRQRMYCQRTCCSQCQRAEMYGRPCDWPSCRFRPF